MRIKATFTYTATTMSYTWGTWFEVETPNSHSQVWVAYLFTKSYKPLECFTIRTSRKEVLDLTLLPTFHLELVSLNQIYTTNGNYDYLMDKSITQLKMNLQVNTKTIVRKFKQILINVIPVVLKRLTLLLIIVLIK